MKVFNAATGTQYTHIKAHIISPLRFSEVVLFTADEIAEAEKEAPAAPVKYRPIERSDHAVLDACFGKQLHFDFKGTL